MERRKRVCIIRSNPVSPDSRVEKEAWSLSCAGYDVEILAWDRDSDNKETTSCISVAEKRIPITRLGYRATYGEGFKNIKSYLKFQYNMVRWLGKQKFDIIHACDFDTAFFSLKAAKKQSAKFIFDIFDFLYGDAQNIFQKVVKKTQLCIINKADATIICTEERREQIKGSKPRNLVVIHNTPAIVQMPKENSFAADTKRTKIVYVGILQDFRLLHEIAECVSESDDIELHIGGFGKYEEYFVDMSIKYENIKFYGRLSYEQTLNLESSCDIMVAAYDSRIENHRFAAPNKFYESLMLGKPIIMVKGTGLSQEVECNDTGVLISYSKQGFADGVHNLMQRKSEWHDMSKKMKKLYKERYDWDTMDKRLIELYRKFDS